MRRYTIVLAPDDGGYVVHVPALPGCQTQGDTVDEAIAHAHEASEGWLAFLADEGLAILDEAEPARIATVSVG